MRQNALRSSTPHLKGGDFSHYQSEALFEHAIRGMKWASVKATEGTTYTDPTFHHRWAMLGKKVHSGQMKLRMAYAFLTPGNGKAQARHFLHTLGIHGKLPAGTRLALDWESSALGHPQVLREAANEIHHVTGQWPVVYCSDSQVHRAKAAVPHAPIWDAKWDGAAPKGAKFVQNSNGPGYDHDYFQGSLAQLEQFAGFHKKPKSPLTATDRHGNEVIAKALKDGPLDESGSAAKYLKRMLDLAGLDAGSGTAFNAKTEKALEQFQSAEGLKATGTLDAHTFTKLKDVELHVRKKTGSYILGQKNSATARAERQLSALGYKTGKHDGVWDRQDAAALKSFKRDAHDKDRTGVLGKHARELLSHDAAGMSHHPYRVRHTLTTTRKRLDALTKKEAAKERDGVQGLKLGDSGRAVANVQARLTAAGFSPPREAKAKFDAHTQAAVEAFQRHSGLKVTGQVDAKTWSALAKTVIYSKKTPIAEWEKSGQVKKLEQDLRALGHKSVHVDGLFGSHTRAAVKAFEKKHHLKQDGVVTARELQLIDHAAHAGGGKKAYQIAHSLLGKNIQYLKTHGPLSTNGRATTCAAPTSSARSTRRRG
jgi:peptidoglycan hydrolase-like protein with peptidoglycan-binding domain